MAKIPIRANTRGGGGKPFGSGCLLLGCKVSPETREQMERYPWVNWSAVMREAIERTVRRLDGSP